MSEWNTKQAKAELIWCSRKAEGIEKEGQKRAGVNLVSRDFL